MSYPTLPLKRLLVLALSSLTIVAVVLIVYSVMLAVDLRLLLGANMALVLLSLALCVLSAVISGVRFYVLLRGVGCSNVDVVEAIIMRCGSLFIANVSPFLVGDEALRALMLKALGCELSRASHVVVLEAYLDVMIMNTPALAISLFKVLTGSSLYIPILICSAYLVTSWSILVLALSRGILSRVAEKLKIAGIHQGLRKPLNLSGMGRNLVISAALTLISALVASIALSTCSASMGFRRSLMEAFEALVLSNSMGIVPTPGGVGGVEYALSLLISPQEVVMWRVISYHFMTVVTGLLLLLSLKIFSERLKC